MAAEVGIARRIARWLSPAKLWRDLRAQELSGSSLAAGIAVGAFVANLPVYPLQSAVAIGLAAMLGLHPLAVLLGSQLSFPPLNAILIALAIATGHFVLHGEWLSVSHFDVAHLGLAHVAKDVLIEWVIGSVIVGAISAFLSFFVTLLVMKAIRPRAPLATAGDATPPATAEARRS